MSMLCNIRRISKEQAESLISDPRDILFFLYGSEPYEPPRGYFKKLIFAKSETKQKREWEGPPENSVLELDKNWHVIHYLLSRRAWEAPLPQGTLLGGTELGTVDVGYGPARLLSPHQIDAFRNFLDNLNKDDYAAGVTGAELVENEIYGAFPEWSQENADHLWTYIEALKSFLSKAKANDESIIIYLY